MPFLADYQCDVFVSYATANNQSLAEGKPGWVTSFRDALKKLLDEGLSRRNVSEVWMDYKLRGNDPFDEQLRETVSKAGILLLLMSDAYMESPWCQRELELFLQTTHRGLGRAGCIFLVHYDPVSHDRWPAGIRGLSDEMFRFYHRERDGAVPKPLGYPIPNPENPAHQRYYDRLLELRSAMTDQLEKMSGQLAGIAPPIEPACGMVSAAADLPSTPAVFLAEVTGDVLFDQRLLVKSYLEQVGYCVFPSKSYNRASAAFAQEMDAELAKCLLFVQMLGRFATPHTPELPGGYEGLQLDRAKAAHKEIMRWRSRDLNLANVPDPEHRRLLEGADVQGMDLEELKRTIVERMRVRTVAPSTPVCGEKFVVVNAAEVDLGLADSIATQLLNWNVGADIETRRDVYPHDLAATGRYDGLVVVYGQCSYQDWLRERLLDCRTIGLRKSQKLPCAVYVHKDGRQEPLRCRPPNVAVLDRQNQADLRSFIDSIRVAP